MQQILLTTSGSVSNITLHDLGGRQLVHPVVDFDLLTEFDSEELRDSLDLQDNIDIGSILLRDQDNDPITDISVALNSGKLQFDKDRDNLVDISEDTQLLAGLPSQYYLDAANINFSTSGSGIIPDTNVQDAIGTLDDYLVQLDASQVAYDNSVTNIPSNNIQGSIDFLRSIAYDALMPIDGIQSDIANLEEYATKQSLRNQPIYLSDPFGFGFVFDGLVATGKDYNELPWIGIQCAGVGGPRLKLYGSQSLIVASGIKGIELNLMPGSIFNLQGYSEHAQIELIEIRFEIGGAQKILNFDAAHVMVARIEGQTTNAIMNIRNRSRVIAQNISEVPEVNIWNGAKFETVLLDGPDLNVNVGWDGSGTRDNAQLNWVYTTNTYNINVKGNNCILYGSDAEITVDSTANKTTIIGAGNTVTDNGTRTINIEDLNFDSGTNGSIYAKDVIYEGSTSGIDNVQDAIDELILNSHQQNSDQFLDFGGSNQISAAQANAKLDDSPSDGSLYVRQDGSWVNTISADGSIDTHSDVDTTTIVPITHDRLRWNGSNWTSEQQLNRYIETYQNSVTTAISTTNVYVTVQFDTSRNIGSIYTFAPTSGNITIDETGRYEIEYALTFANSGNRTQSEARIYLDSGGGFNPVPGSYSRGYHRNTSEGSDTLTKKITLNLIQNDIINIRIARISGTGSLTSVSTGCNLVITKI
jgi:hypothetical protein